MSRYNAIGKRLAAVDGDTVTITFDEFERLVGGPLPDSARQYSAWWSNSRSDTSHSWANEWLHNGWETTRVNVNDSAITFRRVLRGGPAPPSPIPSDFDDSPPGRGVTTVYRILREMLDYGVIPLSLRDIALVNQHVIGERFVDYHNQNIHAEDDG